MLLRAISNTKMNFSTHFPKSISGKMTICNKNDQSCFSDALTSARPLCSRYNPRLMRLGFQHPRGPADVTAQKTCLIPIMVYRFSGNVMRF